ncbi:hypothetical protein NQ315_000088 [Exocentrus adspersus]|uniref:Uncharacterized protein n=1 Tax=Exocentrus adspersus TaxID=1586481 RepID=A0AAV8VTZ5_9CUCU|nr:hypothetical protein NQ315_000088 [Exocentrus adspersus]
MYLREGEDCSIYITFFNQCRHNEPINPHSIIPTVEAVTSNKSNYAITIVLIVEGGCEELENLDCQDVGVCVWLFI